MDRETAKIYKETLDKVRIAFKKLRKSGIYAYAKALDFDSSGCQALIQEKMDEDSDLRGGIYWNAQNEISLETRPVLNLGYLPRSYASRDEMLKKALEIAQETNKILKDSGLQTVWNGCICNTISIMLLPEGELEASDLEAEKRPCFCEKIWETQFSQFAEAKLGKH